MAYVGVFFQVPYVWTYSIRGIASREKYLHKQEYGDHVALYNLHEPLVSPWGELIKTDISYTSLNGKCTGAKCTKDIKSHRSFKKFDTSLSVRVPHTKAEIVSMSCHGFLL